MRKLMLGIALVVLFACSGVVRAEEPVNDSGPAAFKKVKAALDFLDDTLTVPGVKFQDLRISPTVRWEKGFEIPVESGFMALQEGVVPVLKKIQDYAFADTRLVNRAITMSVSAERTDGGVLLTVTLNHALVCGEPAGRPHVDLWNQRMVKVFSSLFQASTCEPRIKGGQPVAEGGPATWLTNVRLDSDGRLQVTGYALSFKAATALVESLYKTGNFPEASLCNLNRNTYEKVPVWRFDLVATTGNAGSGSDEPR
ncbi:MAG: PilN domain-containing protein [Candidatus Riflebacteria bacterium]|nr:PilN domain-containing protein [Candidatus Riflebacteria bacterium]